MGRPKKKQPETKTPEKTPELEAVNPIQAQPETPELQTSGGEFSTASTPSDQAILDRALSGKMEQTEEGLPSPGSMDPVAGAESCIILLSTARNMFGVEVPIPDHISSMWKNAYVQVAKKYGFDLLGSWGPEISLCIASYLLLVDTTTNMPKKKTEEETKTQEENPYQPVADEIRERPV